MSQISREQLTSTGYVNYAGAPVALDPQKHAKPKVSKGREAQHLGWRVVGIPPGAMEAARKQREAEIAYYERASEASKGTKAPKPWDESAWRAAFKKSAVRSKPYAVRDAAAACASLAEKAGWTSINVVEIKREGSA
jgi:hypothetical protein